MSAPRPYLRPMRGWWRENPFLLRYMVREVTAVLVAAYALVLLAGLACLALGEPSYAVWLRFLKHPFTVGFHAVTLLVFLYHTWSWFEIMPKTMPAMFVGGKRVTATTITMSGLAAAVAAAVALFVVVWMLRP